MIFDVSDYTLPTFDSIDWQKTKEQVGIFLRAYKMNRERMGLPVYPKLTIKKFESNEKLVEFLKTPRGKKYRGEVR
ncbi:hypothetical protein [Enterococcus faecalis]|uniref:hypothetical protein n=1 Tax=Enterococcus faecalis TaxID=1351 RepID=UPI002DB79A5D|nr:hypothetical protein [Enterococcus faecalis]MEB7776319.1 hypothetical protein [Enterococcus faecalis]